jgi:hypothetical protein
MSASVAIGKALHCEKATLTRTRMQAIFACSIDVCFGDKADTSIRGATYIITSANSGLRMTVLTSNPGSFPG